ncbi:ferritin-like domain-containing protein [Hymenobacter rubidus]|uniref:ferritin-like domain-containing protein n=1 Tax=Hymenobacter rubidus TaxID=1441626 RepID=UPI0019203464|nr:ferritin-like domain-containing protein [Hymenobacter rubidus]
MADNLQPLHVPIKRRSFFMYAGATAGATALVLAGCSKDSDTTPSSTISLGTGDASVLNYAYALEQLEAAFYAQVAKAPAADFSATELLYFQEVAKHEAIHRDFLKAAINRDAPGKLLQDLTPNFTTVDFTKRKSVLDAAQAFEDLGVSAYNGAGKLIKNAAYLVIAGQIVSVEARHASIIRDFVSPGTFSDTADANGLDLSRTPVEVLTIAQQYITEKLDGSTVGQ